MKKTAILMSMLVVMSVSGQMKKALASSESFLRKTKSTTNLLADAGLKKTGERNLSSMDLGCVTLAEPGFRAMKDGAEIDFMWSSVSEHNSGEYAIQRSENGQNFETIELVKAAGISGEVIEYSKTEFTPEAGTAMYRLMISSKDGQTRFSSPVTVSVLKEDLEKEDRNYDRRDSAIAKKYGINESQVLLVLRDNNGNEQYSKFMMLVQDKQLIAVDIESRVNPGKYLIVATSNNRIYGKKVWVK
jgi:fibronectin type 3 domain-containing protein